MSPPTVSRALADLKADDPGWWVADDSVNGGAHILRLGSRAGVLVGVDVGRHHLRTTVSDAHGKWLVNPPIEEKLNAEELGPTLVEEVVDRVITAVAKASEHGRLYRLEDIRAIGVGVPTPVERNGVIARTFLTEWSGLALEELLRGLLAKKAEDTQTRMHPELCINIAKDADLGAMAAWRDFWDRPADAGNRYDETAALELADPRKPDSLLYIKASNGVDASFICGGERVLGARGMAAQVGHMALPQEERPLLQRTMKKELDQYVADEACPRCQRRRCLENLASGQAILRQLRQLKERDDVKPSVGNVPPTVEALTSHVNGELAVGTWGHEAVNAAGTRVGAALGEVARLADPAVIVIGGLLACTGEVFMGSLRRAFVQTAFTGARPRIIQVAPSEIKRIELRGAVYLAREALLDSLSRLGLEGEEEEPQGADSEADEPSQTAVAAAT
jgi:predicted NBD/HSP70 family sugar kinase